MAQIETIIAKAVRPAYAVSVAVLAALDAAGFVVVPKEPAERQIWSLEMSETPTVPVISEAAIEAATIALWNRSGGGPDPVPDYIRHDAYATLAAALPHLAMPAVSASTLYRHKKRGTEYVLIGYGRMQCSWVAEHSEDGIPLTADMREVAIYRSATDPTEIWVRPREEFEDGRFEVLK